MDCLRRTVIGGIPVLVFGLVLGVQGALACSDETDLSMFSALQVAEVKPGVGRTHFYKSSCDGGGAKGIEGCRSAAYVMPGDPVLIGDVNDASACAVFVNGQGRLTSGLIKNERVQSMRGGDRASAHAFVGRWVREEAEIRVAAKGAEFAFAGDATYGAKDPNRVKRGAVNMGSFSFAARPEANRLSIGIGGASADQAVPKAKADATDCQLDMVALGPYLVVRDNRQCGGMNVSFTGVYRKK